VADTRGVARLTSGRPAFRHGLTALLLGLALLYTMALRLHSAQDMSMSWVVADMGHQLHQPVRWLEGKWVYRDFSGDNYQPGAIILHATLFRLFGVKASVVSVALALVGAGISIMVYLIARRLVPAGWAIAAYLLALGWNVFYVNIGYPSWYCVLFGLVALWVTLRYTERGGVWRLAVAGVLVGLSGAFKINMGAYQLIGIASFLAWRSLRRSPRRGVWGRLSSWEGGCVCMATLAGVWLLWQAPAWLSFLVFATPIVLVFWAIATRRSYDGVGDEGQRRHFWLEAAWLGLGCMVVSMAWVFPMSRVVWWRILLDGAVMKPLQHAASMFSLAPMPNTNGWLTLGFLVAGAQWLSSRGERRARWVIPYCATAVLLLALPSTRPADLWSALETALRAWESVRYVLFVVICVVGWRFVGTEGPRAGVDDALAATLIFGSWGFLQAYPLSDANHLLWAFQPAFILLVFLGSRLSESLRARAGSPAERRLVSLALGGMALALVGLQFSAVVAHFVTLRPPFARVEYALVDRERVDVYARPEIAETLRAVSEAIVARSGEGDALFDVSGSFFNFMTGRPNPTRHDAMWPTFLSKKDQRKLIEDLRMHRPAVIVRDEAAEQTPMFQARSVLKAYPTVFEFIGAHYERTLQIGAYRLWELK
jgi:hypothetical protein